MKILGFNYFAPAFFMALFAVAQGFEDISEECYADHIKIYHGQDYVQKFYPSQYHDLNYCKGINIEVILNNDDCAEKVKFVALHRDIGGEPIINDFTEFFAHTENNARWFMFGNSGDTIGRSNLAPSRWYLIKIYVKVDGEFEFAGQFEIPSDADCEDPTPPTCPCVGWNEVYEIERGGFTESSEGDSYSISGSGTFMNVLYRPEDDYWECNTTPYSTEVKPDEALSCLKDILDAAEDQDFGLCSGPPSSPRLYCPCSNGVDGWTYEEPSSSDATGSFSIDTRDFAYRAEYYEFSGLYAVKKSEYPAGSTYYCQNYQIDRYEEKALSEAEFNSCANVIWNYIKDYDLTPC